MLCAEKKLLSASTFFIYFSSFCFLSVSLK